MDNILSRIPLLGSRRIVLIGMTVIILFSIVGIFFVISKTNNSKPIITTQAESEFSLAETPTPTLNPNAKIFEVEGSNFQFSPDVINVNQGDTVHIILKDLQGFHDFVIDEFDVKTSVLTANQSEAVTFVADKKGSFKFYCTVGKHRELGMEGNITVN